MEDSDDKSIKSKIDEIVTRVNSIIKNIDELDPAKKEDSNQPEDELDPSEKEYLNPEKSE